MTSTLGAEEDLGSFPAINDQTRQIEELEKCVVEKELEIARLNKLIRTLQHGVKVHNHEVVIE